MPAPVLTTGQYSIGPEAGPWVAYGGRQGTIANGLYVRDTQADTGTISAQDTSVVGRDGQVFGVDTIPGMVITQSGYAYAPGNGATAMDSYELLAGAWNAPAVRLAAGAVQQLRAFYPGSAVVRCTFGRGRKIMPAMGGVSQGLVPWTAQFQSADGIWYSDTISSVLLTTMPSGGGGVIWPVTWPMRWAPQPQGPSTTAANTGPQPTWPWFTFTGPIAQPGVAYANTPVVIGYSGVLKTGDQLIIDTRPWSSTALLNGTPVPGGLTGSAMLSMQLPPGSTVLRFTGQDFTGTATCLVQWRNAHLSIGGSSQ